MAIKFEYGGNVFEVDTPAEALELLGELQRRTHLAERRKTILAAILPHVQPSPWTPELFSRFIERLKHPQIEVLTILHRHDGNIFDENLRHIMGASSNQALAGILSGISKHAIGLGISPREVFWVTNSRAFGKRHSQYRMAERFREIAEQVGWPKTNHDDKTA